MSGKGGTRAVLLVVAGLLGSLLYVHSAGGVARFGDVEAERFYTAPVQWMVDNDITTGTSETCFSPDDFVTRGQAAAFIWRMAGEPGGSPPHPFADVTKDWQQDPVSWMYEEGITTGTSATTYSPENLLTRGQAAALLWRLAGEPGGNPPHPFTDVTAAWQLEAVAWLYANGITTGTSATMFSPDDFVTRGQIAAFLYRYQGSPAVAIDPFSPNCVATTTTHPQITTTTTTTTTVAPPNGRALYLDVPGTASDCADCHGSNGEGGFGPQLNPNDLSVARVASQIRSGGGGMPTNFTSFLTEPEIQAIAQYVAAW